MGIVLAIIGAITVMVALGQNTAPEGTHNIGLMQSQMMTLHIGLTLLIIAALRWDQGRVMRVRNETIDGVEVERSVAPVRPINWRASILPLGILVLVVALAIYAQER